MMLFFGLFARKRKGQRLVFEEILFIGIGVFLLAGISLMFNIMNDSVSDDFEDQNVMQISNFILSAIDKFILSNATSGYMVLRIPGKISMDNYIISGFNPPRKEFMIKMGDNRKIIDSPVDVSGIVLSSGKILKVEYNGSSVFLRGGEY